MMWSPQRPIIIGSKLANFAAETRNSGSKLKVSSARPSQLRRSRRGNAQGRISPHNAMTLPSRRRRSHPKSMDARVVGDQSAPYSKQVRKNAMSSKESVQESILPSLEKRHEILERARQVLLQARKVADDWDQLRYGPHAGSSASRFSVGLLVATSLEQLARAE